MNRDDRVHGALLILNELVRISSMEGEVSNDFNRWHIFSGEKTTLIFIVLHHLTAYA